MIKKLCKAAIFILVAGAIAGAGVKYYLSYELIGRYAGSSLTDMTGRKTTAGKASGNFLSKFCIERIEVKDAAGSGIALLVGRVSASYSFRQILKGNFIVRDIGVCDTLLNVRRAAGGAFDFEDAAAKISSYFSAPSKNALPLKVTVEKLSFSNIKVNFLDESRPRDGSSGVRINRFKIVPRLGMSIFGLEGDFQLVGADGRLSSALKTSGMINLVNQSFNMSLETAGFNLAGLDFIVSCLAPGLKIKSGALDCSAIVNYSGGRSEMSGKLNIKNLCVEHDKLPFPVVADSVNLLFSDNTARLYDTTAGMPGMKIKIEGAFSNLFSPGEFVFNVKTGLSGASFESVFSPLKNVLQMPLLSSYYSTGGIDFALALSGIGFDMKRFDVSSWVEFDRVMLVSRKVGIDLKNLRGKMVFAKNCLTFEKPVTFELMGKPFELKGYVRNIESPVFDLSLKARQGGMVAAPGKFSGSLDLAARASGTAKKYYYSASAGLKNITIEEMGMLPRIVLNGNLSVKNEQLSVRNFSIASSDAVIKCDLDLAGFCANPRIKFTAETGNLELGVLRPLIPAADIGQFFGTADARIGVSGKLDSLGGTAELKVRNAVYSKNNQKGEKFCLPFDSLAASARLSRGTVSAKVDAGLFAGSATIEASGKLSSDPDFKAKIRTGGIDLEKFLAAQGSSGKARTAGGTFEFDGAFSGKIFDFLNKLAGTGKFSVAGARVYGDAVFGSVFSGVPEYNEMSFERADGSVEVAGGVATALDVQASNSMIELKAARTTLNLNDLALGSTIGFRTPNGLSGKVIVGGTLTNPDFRQTIGEMSSRLGEMFQERKRRALGAAEKEAGAALASAAAKAEKNAAKAREIASENIETGKEALEKKLMKGVSDSFTRFVR